MRSSRAPERRPLADLRLHEQAAVVPEMTAAEYALLLDDVRAHGVTDPLDVTEEGVVLDGRHRYRAANELGNVDVPVRVVAPADEVEHMVRAALVRRNISASQRAALIVGFEAHLLRRAEALARRRANLKGAPDVATLPHRGGRSRDLAAAMADCSPRLIQDAQKVMEADPSLFGEVKAGKLPVHRAVKQLERQKRYAALPRVGAPPAGPFQVIYADPPWPSSSPGSAWAPEQHYPTMEIEAIKALAIDHHSS